MAAVQILIDHNPCALASKVVRVDWKEPGGGDVVGGFSAQSPRTDEEEVRSLRDLPVAHWNKSWSADVVNHEPSGLSIGTRYRTKQERRPLDETRAWSPNKSRGLSR